jgi:hypothetical protein
MLDQRGRTLFDALQALFQEDQYCGDLDGGVEGDDVYLRWCRPPQNCSPRSAVTSRL